MTLYTKTLLICSFFFKNDFLKSIYYLLGFARSNLYKSIFKENIYRIKQEKSGTRGGGAIKALKAGSRQEADEFGLCCWLLMHKCMWPRDLGNVEQWSDV